MILYTVQHIDVYKQLMKTGSYTTNPNYICIEGFEKPYEWINAQAKKRIKDWSTDRPIWLWKEKPDLRSYRFIKNPDEPKEQHYVILTLDIPLERVLLSEFGLWHNVLSSRYMAYNDKEDDQMSLQTDKYITKSFDQMPKSLQSKIIKSWSRCLCDKNGELKGFDHDYIKPVSFQAITDRIYKSQIVAVKNFIMKNTAK